MFETWVENDGGRPAAPWWVRAEDVAFVAALNAGDARAWVREDPPADGARPVDVPDPLDPWGGVDLSGPFDTPEVAGAPDLLADGEAGRWWDSAAAWGGQRPSWWPAVPVPGVEELAAGVPGPRLAARLAPVEAQGMDPGGLVELVAAWTRIGSWAAGQAALAAAQLSAAQPMVSASQPADAPPTPRRRPSRAKTFSVSGPELALRLSISHRAAQAMITMGRAISGPLAPVGDALLEGAIDPARARVFVEALTQVPLPVAVDVQDQVLPTAPHRTAPQLTRDIAAALIAVDPAEATARHTRARQDRRVCHPRPLPEGMASIYTVMPAVDAVALDLALDAAARTARAGGDPRTTDQLRADTLAATAHHALATGAFTTLPTPTTPTNQSEDGGAGQAQPTADDHNDAAGPDPAHTDIAGGRDTTTRDSADTAARDSAASARVTGSPDGNRPASDDQQTTTVNDEADADPTRPTGTPPGPEASASPDQSPPETSGPPSPSRRPDPFLDDLAAPRTCTLPDIPPGGFRIGRISGRTARIDVTVPLHVLLGNDTPAPGTLAADTTPTETTTRACGADPDSPAIGDPTDTGTTTHERPVRLPPVAVLARYGPISPDVARALALGGTWRRLITDPESGAVRDVGSTRYHPPADLADLIRARDRTCVRPGCSVPASACDLDHTIPHHLHGPTAETNLGPLCTPDHALKTTGTYHVTQPTAGTFTFHLPSGHTYTRHPDGTTTHQRPQEQP